MTAYYYLAASLPSLAFDQPPPLSLKQFRGLCARCMKPHDFFVLRCLLDEEEPEGDHPFLRKWRYSEAQLRNALARVRAARLRRDASPYLKSLPAEPRAERIALETYTRGTPLEREQMLDRFRWNQVIRLAGPRPFTLEAILAYAVRLRICWRWTESEDEAGVRRVREMLAQQQRGKNDNDAG